MMTSPHPHLVIVIDDDSSLRDDLVDYLLGTGYEAIGFASYEQFLAVAHRLQPTLVVLDLGLPGLDGMDACPLLRQRWPQVGVVMLTSRSGVEQQQAGLEAGADAYLPKTATLALVEATVASVLRRLQPVAQPMPSAAAERHASTLPPSLWSLDEGRLQLSTPDGLATVLTVNEFRLVQAIFLARGQPVKRETLLALVNKTDSLNNRRNLDAVISRIRAKVRVSTGAGLPVRASYATGYAFTMGPDPSVLAPAAGDPV